MSDEMDEAKELWKKLLNDERWALLEEREEYLVSVGREVANDPYITPVEAYKRGVRAGVKVVKEQINDLLETMKAASLEPPEGTR